MPRQARVKSNTGIYHIMWRGANRQEIYHDDDDSRMFLEILNKCKDKYGITVYAWCLMSNHVHLLIKEGNEDISITMKRIGVSYVGYYNSKYRTIGPLFQDRFKSECVESNRYLFTVIRYIHQNPVKAGMVTQADEWKWSSCGGYYEKGIYHKKMLDCDHIFNMISTDRELARKKFREFNERANDDKCLEDEVIRKRLSDEEARGEIKLILGSVEIAQVKALPKEIRSEILRKIKQIEGLTLRQGARIVGVPVTLIYRA